MKSSKVTTKKMFVLLFIISEHLGPQNYGSRSPKVAIYSNKCNRLWCGFLTRKLLS